MPPALPAGPSRSLQRAALACCRRKRESAGSGREKRAELVSLGGELRGPSWSAENLSVPLLGNARLECPTCFLVMVDGNLKVAWSMAEATRPRVWLLAR
jgi:hypothetical protein